METIKKISKIINHWLRLFGFKKRERSIKEKMCDAAHDQCIEYKKEARQAVAELRMKAENIPA